MNANKRKYKIHIRVDGRLFADGVDTGGAAALVLI